MKLEVFHLERIQSKWEHIVDYNLSESGVEPLKINELISGREEQDSILATKMGYTQTNGSIPLRRNISKLYKQANEDNITVTNGGSEANLVTIWNMLRENPSRKGIVMQLPNYMQLWGLALDHGADVTPFWMKKEGRWRPDIEALKGMVSKKTCLIALCNPNNPTGAVMHEEELRAIADIAEDAGAWILSDEIYAGAELNDNMTPSMWDFYDDVLITSGLSKAYALPGLRIGWVACKDEAKVEELWSYTDYTSIAPSMLGDVLGRIALEPETRKEILARTRSILKENWLTMESWLNENNDLFAFVPPEASAVCLIEYESNISSDVLAERLIKEESVLIAPGDYFHMPKHIRIGYGHDKSKLVAGLTRTAKFLRGLD